MQQANAPNPGLIARAMMALIRVYQLTLSAIMGRTCRHVPSCSAYAKEAIEIHGAWAGVWLGLFRVLRCNPWGTHGIDNVPDEVPRYDPLIWRYWKYGQNPMAE